MGSRVATRVFVSIWLATSSAAVSWYFWSQPREDPSDFTQLWGAARALANGVSPYEAVGPGRPVEWDFPLLYPLPAVLFVAPFALLPLRVADPIFVGLGAGALAWALTRDRLDNPQLLLFASAAFIFTIQTSQWSALIMAAALQPALGFLLACKPQLAAALLIAYPSRRTIAGALVFLAASIIFFSWWPREWVALLPTARHMTAPITVSAGPVLLLATLKWRRPEARLLLAMACIPHTPLLYEALPLFLVSRRLWESAVLSILSVVVATCSRASAPFATFEDWAATSAWWILWLMYVPCLVLVLMRKNSSKP